MNRKQIECDEKIAQAGGIAVLSAVTPEEAVLKAGKLLSAGIRALEIPYRGKDFFDGRMRAFGQCAGKFLKCLLVRQLS